MNGIEVTRQIRSLGDDTPIIILTAYDWTDIEEEARAAGFYPVSLGKRILRTETAGLTMLSILMYQMETAK